ncbi:helix-turn-helix transcriptional regulator [Micromonospora tulbaghiae]|uniref:helix-turn-helix transcriptional regulator n=1 Tax=Micromonospora tulbaghiae TaxID=479978 RepID=UPI0033E2910C
MTGDGTSTLAETIRVHGETVGASAQQIVERIHEQTGVSWLRAHRLGRGWKLQEVVNRLKDVYLSTWGEPAPVSHQRLSRWETGHDVPSMRYLDCLCRLYRTRPDLLGFGADYSEDDVSEPARPAEGTSWLAGRSPQESGGPMGVDRRFVLKSLAVYGGVASSAPLLEALNQLREDADELLNQQSVNESTVGRWEATADDYGYSWLTLPPYDFLAQAMPDFAAVKHILSRRQPLDLQKRLYRVMAQIAGLIASSVNAVTDSRETHAWFHVARLAAEEADDRMLRAWVAANEGMSYLWYDRPAQRAVDLARTASALAGRTPTAAGALAAAIEARALARLGRRDEVRMAVRHSDEVFERLEEPHVRATRLGLHEHRLRFSQGNALSMVGDHREAAERLDRAVMLTDVDAIEACLVRLDMAACAVGAGELERGGSATIAAIRALPLESRNGIALSRARTLIGTASSRQRGSRTIVDLQEHLRAITVEGS